MSRKAISIMRSAMYSFVTLVAFLLMGFSQITPVWALPIPAFTGNTPMTTVSLEYGGTTDYAVWAPGWTVASLGTPGGFVLGASSPAFDSGASSHLTNYLYTYEPVNDTNTPSGSPVAHPGTAFVWNTVAQNYGLSTVSNISPTSWGFFTGTIFNSPGNGDVGQNNPLTDPAATLKAVALSATQVNPTHVSIDGIAEDVCFNSTVIGCSGGATNLSTGVNGSVYAFTSPTPPAIGFVGWAQGITSSGHDPVPAPEPSSVLLSMAGLAGFAGTRWRAMVRRLGRARG